mmetsp:Transcript_114803/g.263524  ORF Transcript_114803/g.263524 Transcript_114803/m.263524 type:complete len:422 (+) Transcript_114803:185-1450(+)
MEGNVIGKIVFELCPIDEDQQSWEAHLTYWLTHQMRHRGRARRGILKALRLLIATSRVAGIPVRMITGTSRNEDLNESNPLVAMGFMDPAAIRLRVWGQLKDAERLVQDLTSEIVMCNLQHRRQVLKEKRCRVLEVATRLRDRAGRLQARHTRSEANVWVALDLSTRSLEASCAVCVAALVAVEINRRCEVALERRETWEKRCALAGGVSAQDPAHAEVAEELSKLQAMESELASLQTVALSGSENSVSARVQVEELEALLEQAWKAVVAKATDLKSVSRKSSGNGRRQSACVGSLCSAANFTWRLNESKRIERSCNRAAQFWEDLRRVDEPVVPCPPQDDLHDVSPTAGARIFRQRPAVVRSAFDSLFGHDDILDSADRLTHGQLEQLMEAPTPPLSRKVTPSVSGQTTPIRTSPKYIPP